MLGKNQNSDGSSVQVYCMSDKGGGEEQLKTSSGLEPVSMVERVVKRLRAEQDRKELICREVLPAYAEWDWAEEARERVYSHFGSYLEAKNGSKEE